MAETMIKAPIDWTAKKYFMINLALVALIVVVYIGFTNANYPYVGSDLSYSLPRLLDTHIHYLKNGLSIQWWTPAFGGGLPAYSNPHHIQFSLPQLLLFIMDPWKSFNLLIVISVIAGHLGCYIFLRKIVSVLAPYATLGAVIFSANGFLLQHAGVGHGTFLGFTLLPFLALLLLEDKWPVIPRAIGIATIAAYLVYGGGFYISVLMIQSCIFVMLISYILDKNRNRNFFRTMQVVLLGGAFSIILTISKLSAIYHFMRFFPRIWHESYSINLLHAFAGFFFQLFYVPVSLIITAIIPRSVILWAKESDLPLPVQQFFGVINPDRFPATPLALPIDGHEIAATGCGYGLWETDIGVSPVLLYILVLALSYWRSMSRIQMSLIWKRHGHLLVAIFACTWVTLEMIFAKGYLNAWLTHLPVLQSLHVTVRYTAAFILPLIVLGIHALAKKYHGLGIQVQRKKCLSMAFTGILLYFFYLPLPIWYAHDLGYGYRGFWNVESIIQDWNYIQDKFNDFKIDSVSRVFDTDVFQERSSSMYTYEPIFGYSAGGLQPKFITDNSVFYTENDHFNLINPASLAFPEVNHIPFLSPIHRSDKENLQKLVAYGQPDWKISFRQKIANWVSLWGAIIMTLTLILYYWRARHMPRSL
ncbi:MAG: hypothetical protein HQL65_14515 [Magnetococcales bacterium]|nr:hypothetical protein [Magnetococcales bacterium]